MKFNALLLCAVFGCATLSLAHAQQLPANVPVPGNSPLGGTAGVTLVPSNRLVAPPAPNAAAAPKAFGAWQRAVGGRPIIEAPQSVQITGTNISNGPVRNVGPSAPYAAPQGAVSNNIVTTTSSNWSGIAIYNPSDPFTVEAIIGEFVVPTAHQAFGACTGGWDYSSQWVGIDGFGSSDVLQAGVEADAYCSGSTTATLYSAWIEWYPNNETRVSSPVINPGDLVFVEVWNTSATAGYAYIYNYSTNVGAEYALSAPSGTNLVGNSVEWIVERPGVGGGLATLTNYIDVSFPNGFAWNYTASSPTYYYEGQNPATGTLYDITMVDNNGKGISSVTVENIDFLYFQDFGSACGIGGPPC